MKKTPRAVRSPNFSKHSQKGARVKWIKKFRGSSALDQDVGGRAPRIPAKIFREKNWRNHGRKKAPNCEATPPEAGTE